MWTIEQSFFIAPEKYLVQFLTFPVNDLPARPIETRIFCISINFRGRFTITWLTVWVRNESFSDNFEISPRYIPAIIFSYRWCPTLTLFWSMISSYSDSHRSKAPSSPDVIELEHFEFYHLNIELLRTPKPSLKEFLPILFLLIWLSSTSRIPK